MLPSSILHLGEDDDWVDAYSIDQAVWSFGSALQQALDEAEKGCKNDKQRNAKRAQVFARWLPGMADTARHRDPAHDNPEGVRR